MERPSPTIPPKPDGIGPGKSGSSVLSARKSGSLLKKNEIMLIVGVCLALIVLVWFVFVPGKGSSSDQTAQTAEILKRLEAVEAALADLQAGQDKDLTPVAVDTNALAAKITPVKNEVKRMETRVMLKYDTMGERMAKLEKKLNSLQTTVAKASASAPKVAPAKPAAKQVVKPKPKAKPKTVAAAPKKVYHTVKKGETLWRISQRYKVSLVQLRKLNKLTEKSKIYPGIRLRVK